MFQPRAPHRVPMEAPVCAGTSVCVLLAGPEQDATQVNTAALQHSYNRFSEAVLDCHIQISFSVLCQSESYFCCFYAILFFIFTVPLRLPITFQRCVSCPVLTADAVWGLIPASAPLTTQAPSASCVSNKTTNTSGISYIRHARSPEESPDD